MEPSFALSAAGTMLRQTTTPACHGGLRGGDVAGLVDRVDGDGRDLLRHGVVDARRSAVWTSPLLSRLMTLKPYLSAFFWYIFQEKAWDGFCIWAMNARVGFSAAAGVAARALACGRRGCRGGRARAHHHADRHEGGKPDSLSIHESSSSSDVLVSCPVFLFESGGAYLRLPSLPQRLAFPEAASTRERCPGVGIDRNGRAGADRCR